MPNIETPSTTPEGGDPAPVPVVVDPALIAPPPVVPDPEEAPVAFSPEQLEYVQKLRKENGDRRVASKGWEDSFSAFDAKDQEWIQETFRLASSQDPTVAQAGVARIEEMKNILTGQEPGTPTPAPIPAQSKETEPVANPDDAPVTVAQFKKWQDEQTQANRVNSQKGIIDAELAEAGFPKGSAEYRMALVFARDDTNGDLKEAVGMVGQYQQAIRDTAIGAKSEQSGMFPTAAGNTAAGSPASPESQAAPSWEEARAQLNAMLTAEPGEQA